MKVIFVDHNKLRSRPTKSKQEAINFTKLSSGRANIRHRGGRKSRAEGKRAVLDLSQFSVRIFVTSVRKTQHNSFAAVLTVKVVVPRSHMKDFQCQTRGALFLSFRLSAARLSTSQFIIVKTIIYVAIALHHKWIHRVTPKACFTAFCKFLFTSRLSRSRYFGEDVVSARVAGPQRTVSSRQCENISHACSRGTREKCRQEDQRHRRQLRKI